MVTAPGQRWPRHVVVDAPDDALVEDLRATLGLAPGSPPGEPVALRHGSDVGAATTPPTATGPLRLVVACGPDAGVSAALVPGRWLSIGRAASCDVTIRDPALSRRHLRVRQEPTGVLVEDLGSTNGIRWDPVTGATHGEGSANASPSAPVRWPPGATLTVGGSRLALVLQPLPPAAGRHLAGRLHVTPWTRPPAGPSPVSVTTPDEPCRREVAAPSAWVWALPLVAGCVAAVVLRMPTILLFAAMAPLMTLGHHLGERRNARRDHASAAKAHREALRKLRTSTAQALAQELTHLRDRDPGVLGVVTSLVPRPTTGLWSRGGEPPAVVLGEGTLLSGVSLDGTALAHDAAPVVLDLSHPVAVVGTPDLRARAVRGWLLQLACGHPPSQVSLVLDPTDPPGTEWDLLAWLPQTRPREATMTPAQVTWGAGGLQLYDDQSQVPAGTTLVLIKDVSTAVLRRPGVPDVWFRPTLVGGPLARSLARALAGLDVEDGVRTGAGDTVPDLGDLLTWPRSEAEVRRGWGGQHADLRVPVGTDEAGSPVLVDLAVDGPHALVAGTTGSGKSELLRTLVAALALRNSPSSLGVLLIDYKGGSSFGECAGLPHSVGLVTDLDPHLAERVLLSLRAELHRRETVLAQTGARDVQQYTGDDLPRLVVVIDEFRVLAEELPDFLAGLVRLAAVGRSLGVHLVLATQRPAGVVSADLRANVNLRIALRVRDAADSLDVLEVPDAAALPAGQPGRGLLRTGSGPPRRVQVALAAPGAPGRGERGWHVEDVADAWEGWRRLHEPDPPETGGGLGELARLLVRVAEADGDRARRVWLPPLPETVPARHHPGAWAVADRPERQDQTPLTWSAGHHVGVVGAARSGRSTAARALLAAAGPAWVYVVDPARGLEGTEIATHPGLRAWVGPQDAAHALRVLEVVDAAVDERRTGAGTAHGPPVVLVIDGWDRFVEAYDDVARGRARDLALRILRDGATSGVVVLVTGDRSVLLGAVASALPETWALHLHDPGDLSMAGLRPRQVPDHQPPGRLVRTHDGLVAQVLQPEPDHLLARPAGSAPARVVSLPHEVTVGSNGPWALGGDLAEGVPPVHAPFLVLGPPGSGVSATLDRLAATLGGDVVRVDPGTAVDTDTLASLLAPGAARAALVDDAHLLAGSRAEDLLLAWAERGGGQLLVGAELEASGSLFRGLVPTVARHRRGLVLQPRSAADGALLGARLPTGDPALPGRGVLVDRGRCTRVQVTRLSGRAADPARPVPPAPPDAP